MRNKKKRRVKRGERNLMIKKNVYLYVFDDVINY